MTSSSPGAQRLRAVGSVLGLLISVAMIWAVHQHDVWRPWFDGFVTESFADALWAIDLSLAVQAVGYGVQLVWRSRVVHRATELVNALTGFVSVWTVRAVYPFDAGGFDWLVRFVLFFAVFGTCIAIFTNAVRVVAAGWATVNDREG